MRRSLASPAAGVKKGVDRLPRLRVIVLERVHGVRSIGSWEAELRSSKAWWVPPEEESPAVAAISARLQARSPRGRKEASWLRLSVTPTISRGGVLTRLIRPRSLPHVPPYANALFQRRLPRGNTTMWVVGTRETTSTPRKCSEPSDEFACDRRCYVHDSPTIAGCNLGGRSALVRISARRRSREMMRDRRKANGLAGLAEQHLASLT